MHTLAVVTIRAVGPVTPKPAPVQPTCPPQAQPTGKVKKVKAVVRKGKVKVGWKTATAATSYRVRISKPGAKKYKAWKTTTKPVFKVKVRKGKMYRFQVAGIGADGRGPITTKRFKGKQSWDPGLTRDCVPGEGLSRTPPRRGKPHLTGSVSQ